MPESRDGTGGARGRYVVIGTGPGSPEWIAPISVSAAAECSVWFGSKDAIAAMSAMTPPAGATIEMSNDVHASLEILAQAMTQDESEEGAGGAGPSGGAGAPQRAAVLVTGDPLVFSLLDAVRKRFGSGQVEVVPAIGSFQLALARMGLLVREAEVASVHGRGTAGLRNALRSGKAVVCLTDPRNDAVAVCRFLIDSGEGERGVAVLTSLGRPDESLLRWESGHDLIRECAEEGMEHGGPSVVIILPRVPVTKPEVRAVVVSKLGLAPSSVVIDVGCGSGSVTEAIARMCPSGVVHAIDRNPDAVRSTTARIRAAGVENVQVHFGAAPESLEGLVEDGSVDALFAGGTGGSVDTLFEKAASLLRKDGRLVSTAVSVGMPGRMIDAAAASGLRLIECLQMQVSRAEVPQEAFGERTAEAPGAPLIMRGENPVTILVFAR